jgi:hypothetical protein
MCLFSTDAFQSRSYYGLGAVLQTRSPGHHARIPGPPSLVALAHSNKADATNDSFHRPGPALPQPSVSRRPFAGTCSEAAAAVSSPPRPSPPLGTSIFSSLIDLYSSPLFIPRRRSEAKLFLFLRLPLVPPGSVSPGVEDPAFLAACSGSWLFLGSCTTGKRGRRGGLVGLR